MNQTPTPIDIARQRFGKPFAADKGSTWQPRPDGVFLLSLWREQLQAERQRQRNAA
jgi:hypothetical protein